MSVMVETQRHVVHSTADIRGHVPLKQPVLLVAIQWQRTVWILYPHPCHAKENNFNLVPGS